MDEAWRDIPQYIGYYQASNLGRIRSVERIAKNGRMVKSHIIKIKVHPVTGYCMVTLGIDGKPITKLVHRLVASAFMENPNRLPQINHIDENKENNAITNLEWCTAKHNMNHGTQIERARRKKFKPVNMYTIDNVFIRRFESLDEAAKFVHGKGCNIAENCKWNTLSSYGYKWHWCYATLAKGKDGKCYAKGLTENERRKRCQSNQQNKL